MAGEKTETVLRWFELLGAGDLEAAFELTTDDAILDRRNSNAPWRGLVQGREAARAAFADLRDAVDGVNWEPAETREVGSDMVAVATVISGRGRSSGAEVLARGGWLFAFDGDLLREGILYQSFDEAVLAGRRRRLDRARLYFVCEAQPNGVDPGPLLQAALAGGVDVIQMREKSTRGAEELVTLSRPFVAAAREHGALFFLNDRPDLVAACDADGVHVGQDDEPVARARAVAGPAALVGLSTHSPEQFDAALEAEGDNRPDQLSAGPVWETPTKQGRPAAGLGLVEHAARVAGPEVPWFAIGGIDAANVDQVVAAGARRIVVVRAIRDAADPEAAAGELRAALDRAAGV
jgi:thiamine-phosphate pyrophosphorylase